MLNILNKDISSSCEITTREIVTLMFLHGQLKTSFDFNRINFSNNHWILLTNVTESHPKLPELLLSDIVRVYD